MTSIQPKKKVKASYRGDKKPSMAARKKAATIAAKRNKKALSNTPLSFYSIFSIFADFIGLLLLLSGILIFFSLKFPEMISLTEWCSRFILFYAGKSAYFSGGIFVLAGLWILILRRIKKPFSFSWKFFIFFIVVYQYILVLIQHEENADAYVYGKFANLAGGVVAGQIDAALFTAVGNAGSILIYCFSALIMLLIAWLWISNSFSNSLHIHPAFFSPLRKKLKSLFRNLSRSNAVYITEPDPKKEAIPFNFSDTEPPLEEVEDQKKPSVTRSKKSRTPTKEVTENVISDDRIAKPDSKTDREKTFQTQKKLDPLPEKIQPVTSLKNSFRPSLSERLGKQETTEKKDELVISWRLPVTDEILDPIKIRQNITSEDPHIQGQIQKIEHVLDAFDAPGKVVDIQIGPTFTQYGIEPGFMERADRKTRVRVKQIENVKKDLEMALSVKQLTIEAPIPNKTFIGLQVQNKYRIPVTLREIIESDVFQKNRKGLGIALGKDINGAVYAADLTRMPHLLIAGATGSGKSVCLNAILVCLLMNYTPDQLKLVLIDPKRVELTGYNGIPHLITPVITDVEQVGNVLQWILREMDMRNLHFMQTGVRNIQDYNQKNPDKILPYLVVVIDELANLMMEAASDIETSITRLAQTARAMGIHIIVATQRPSRDVITGTIKGNLPSRIAFAVATNIDSHVILDRSGAENLFGKGDMYFMSSEDSNLKRLQCVYVSDDEIRKLVDYWKKNPRIGDEQSEMKTNTISPVTVRAQPQITQGTLTQLPMLNEDISSVKKGDDPLLNEAIAMVRKQGRASANMLVSRLSIGFTRANKLLSQMEDMGIISPPNANPAIPREILDYGENGAPPED